MEGYTRNVLVVGPDPVERTRLAAALEGEGFDVLLCPGPSAPEYGCIGATKGRCPLATDGCVVVLDLAVYGQHVLMHRVPWLWRLHRVHHADVDVDATTGVRFHPLEYLLSLGLKGGTVIALALRPTADYSRSPTMRASLPELFAANHESASNCLKPGIGARCG